MNSVQLLDKKNQLKKEAYDILNICKTEIRNLSDEEKTKIDSIKKEIRSINEEINSINKSLELEKEEIDERNLENKNNTENKTKKMEKRKFSLVKAIRNIANNQKQDAVTEAVISAGMEEARKSGINYSGQICLPSEELRDLSVTAEGDDVVATNLMDIIKPLQSRNVLAAAGAKFVTGLVSDIQYPVMSKANCAWATENGAAEQGNISFTNIKLSPKRLSVVVPISKQLLVQDSIGVENAIREEIINAINAKIEATVLGNGAGSANEPKGFFPSEGDTSLTSITDFKGITDLESGLEDVNGELTYLVSPKAKSALRNMAKSAKSTQLVMEGGEVDGTKALSTSHLTANHVIVGDFSEYIIANWGGVDITVDGYTLAANGQIRLVVNTYFDMKPLREEAFKIAKIGA